LPLNNGGLGDFYSSANPIDSDEDGIPDAWELKLGLNPNDPSDALKASTNSMHSGYLNIEVYINSLLEEEATDFIRPPKNINITGVSFDQEPAFSEVTLNWHNNENT